MGSQVSDIVISRSYTGHGIGSVITSQLSCSVADDIEYGKGSYLEVLGFGIVPMFFIDKAEPDENITTITAYDRTKQLSDPFFPPDDESMSSSALANAAATQCGFDGISGEIANITVNRNLYENTSCLNIIQMLATVSGAVVMADISNRLYFADASKVHFAATAEKWSKVKDYPTHTYSKIYVTGESSEALVFGTGKAENTIELSNPLFTEESANALYGKILPMTIKPCRFTAIIGNDIFPTGEIAMGDDKYKISSVNIRLCALGAVAECEMDEPPQSSSEYKSELKRQIDAGVAQNRVYGINFINTNGGGMRLKL